jgi:HEAT repeat protein
MPKGRPKKGKPSAAFFSVQNRANSQRSPWRTAAKSGSPRQRRNAAYFDALAEAGDTRRVPRPELD